MAFSINGVLFPVLVDRDVDFIMAIITSVMAVTTNPVLKLGWGVCVVALLIVAWCRCSWG